MSDDKNAVFEQVNVARAANVYFEGKVTSRTLLFADGTRKTLGIMMPGEYEFGTDCHEIMDITAGELDVKLPDQDWISVRGGESFEVAANVTFLVNVKTLTDYCCSYR